MVKEIGLKEEIKGIASKATEEEDVNKVGLDMIFTLIEKFSS